MLDALGISNGEATDYFSYLDNLRSTGAINMLGARPHLTAMFDLDEKVAGRVLFAWMHTFDGSKPLSDRVNAALTEGARR